LSETSNGDQPIPTARFDPLSNTDDRGAYAFLKASGPDGALIELPMGHADDPRELRYQYLTLWHGHRIVNGSSSYTPALTQLLESASHSPLADSGHLGDAVGLVRGVGVPCPPHSSGIASPCGSVRGKFRKASRLSISFLLLICSSSSATSCTSSHPNFNGNRNTRGGNTPWFPKYAIWQ
jgi:hypothetical protein